MKRKAQIREGGESAEACVGPSIGRGRKFSNNNVETTDRKSVGYEGALRAISSNQILITLGVQWSIT